MSLYFVQVNHYVSNVIACNGNDYAAHVYTEYTDLNGHNITCGPGLEEVGKCSQLNLLDCKVLRTQKCCVCVSFIS